MLNLNILMVGGLVPWHPQAGGGQIIAYKISEALARVGHDVHYVAIAPEGYQREVDWGEVTFAPRGPGLLASIPRAIQLASSRGMDEYDIVHLHCGNETVGDCLAYALSRRIGLKPRFVLSISAPKAYAFPRSPGEVITAISCRSAHLIFSLSEFSRSDISRAYRIAPSKIQVTYAGVDSSFLAAMPSRPHTDTPHLSLLYSGRLNGPREQKGIDVLLSSLPLVVRHHDVALNLIGTGPRLEQYGAQAEELNMHRYVKFLGFIEHDKMPAYYAQADLFVLPSRRESFGLVLAEAMACGLPVVATTAGAIPEVVEDGVTGLLVPPDDPEALAGAMNSLLGDPAKMKAMGAQGREKVEKHFTWDKVAERVVEGYHKVL